MAGFSDYIGEQILDYLTGQKPLNAVPAVYLGLATVAPTNDSGTFNGTEVTTTSSAYARVQVAGAQAVDATTSTSSAVLNFASGPPSWIQVGMYCYDSTTPGAIARGTYVLSINTSAHTITMSANAAATVGASDTIIFSAFAPTVPASGTEPAVVPAYTQNTQSIVTFLQSTANWGTVTSWFLIDSLSATTNMLCWDWLGNYKWNPFTDTSLNSGSGGVLTAPAHGYSNGDNVVVSSKFGGSLPTGGSFAGLLTVANITTDTFTVGVLTTTTGGGLVRKVATQAIPNGITPSFAAGSFQLSAA